MLFVIYSKQKAKERNKKEKSLQTAYEEAKTLYEADPTDLNQNRLNEAKETFELFYEQKIAGVIIRARARWHEHGERSTKYFLNLEKRNNVKKHIRKLHASGVITTDPFKIQYLMNRNASITTCINQNLLSWIALLEKRF